MIIGLIRHGRPTVMRRLLIRSKRRVLIASDYLERPVERPHDKVDRAQPIAIDRARSFHVARWSLETGTSVPVAPVWTRATGRELVAIDRARFGKVSCGHGLRHDCTSWGTGCQNTWLMFMLNLSRLGARELGNMIPCIFLCVSCTIF